MTRSNNDDRNILPDIGDDPIAAAEALVQEFVGARTQLYQCIAKAMAIAEVLKANDEKWTAFKAHVAHHGFHVSESSPLRTVMCFLFKAKKPAGAAYDRACCYTRAVQQLCKEEAASATNIADLIRARGGVEELYAEAKAARLAEKARNGTGQEPSPAGYNENADEPSNGSANETDASPQAGTSSIKNQTGLSNGGKKKQPKEGETESSREPRKFSKEWCERRLILEISPSKLRDVLGMRDRQRGFLDFACGGKDDAGFKIYNVDTLQLD